MADTQIVKLILDELLTHLTTELITNIGVAEPSRADVVKLGRVLENPKVKNIRVGIIGGDIDKLDFLDGVVTLEDHKRIGMYVVTREVGGGTAWWRRGTCPFHCYFLEGDLTESVAMTYAYEFYGRIQKNIENLAVSSLTDDFGEQAQKMFLIGASMNYSGGNGKWIYRGKVLWECLTWKG